RQVNVNVCSSVSLKESVVATLGSMTQSSTCSITTMLQTMYTPLSSVSFMVMILLYTPCTATIATVKRETNSYKWAIFTLVYTFIVAWIFAVLVYQIGTFLGF